MGVSMCEDMCEENMSVVSVVMYINFFIILCKHVFEQMCKHVFEQMCKHVFEQMCKHVFKHMWEHVQPMFNVQDVYI
jgi:hypothetical protein